MFLLFSIVTANSPPRKLDGIAVRAKTGTPTPSPSKKAVASSPMAKKSPTATSSGTCFPGDALVKLEDGTSVRMDNLRVGDRVAVGGGMFSDVFMFTHELKGKHKFIRIETDNKLVLDVSNGHYLWINGVLTEAQNVEVGDNVVLEDGINTAMVIRVTMNVVAEGLYNPQTTHGDILVNGVIASTYTKVTSVKVAHAAFAPLRAIFGSFGNVFKWNNALADMVYMAVDKLMA